MCRPIMHPREKMVRRQGLMPKGRVRERVLRPVMAPREEMVRRAAQAGYRVNVNVLR